VQTVYYCNMVVVFVISLTFISRMLWYVSAFLPSSLPLFHTIPSNPCFLSLYFSPSFPLFASCSLSLFSLPTDVFFSLILLLFLIILGGKCYSLKRDSGSPNTMKDLHALISAENSEIRTPENTTSDDSIMSKKSGSVILSKKLNGNATGNGSNVGEFYDEKRIPSYTDRVLYKSLPAFTQNLKLISFQSCEDVPSSDHKPVVTAFTVKTTDGGQSIVLNTAGDGVVFDLFEMKGINLAEMDTVLGQAGKHSVCT
jgi:hypothetical protein